MNTRLLLDKVDLGLVILDGDFKVMEWNHWMAIHTGISAGKILGTKLFHFFPDLNTQSFLRNFKSVLTFGNTVFFSQKLHNYLFPCRLVGAYALTFEFMQQRCTMAALDEERGKTREVLITVQDVTENVALEKHLKELNLVDPLTRVFNRRYLDKRLKEEYLRFRRYSAPLSLLMLDLDYFKKVNDSLGHVCGDIVLRQLTALITSIIRGNDILTRYGGEEFCCILPNTDIDGAVLIAERLREQVEEHEFNVKDTVVRITVSLGIAEASDTADAPDTLIDLADKALYRAKNMGRNRVETSG